MITKTQHFILIWIGFNITKYDNYNIFHPTRGIFIHLKNELSIKHFKQNLQSYPVSQLWPYFFSSFTRNKKDHFSFLIYIYIYHLRGAINLIVYTFSSFHRNVNNPRCLLPDSWDCFPGIAETNDDLKYFKFRYCLFVLYELL